MHNTEYAIVGGGLVGMAIACGLVRRGRKVTVFDESDDALRASRGNFGLVWVQSKGHALPDYSRWSQLSSQLWPEFRDELTGATGVDLELKQPGGLNLFLSDDEAERNVASFNTLKIALGGDYPFEYLDHAAVKKMLPEIGPKVVGATWFPMDGHVNPLYLLQTMHRVFANAGGTLVNGAAVSRIEPKGEGFTVHGAQTWHADRVVLCAGLGNAHLAPMVGLHAPVKPNQGQVLITERLQPFMHYPTVTVRQVGEGAVQIGDSKEDVGFDTTTRHDVIGRIARRAVDMFPILETVRVVRTWAALRVMSEDGHPIYDRSILHPGASVVTCHSGVTLAAAHALVLAKWIDDDEGPDYLENFSVSRFDATAPN